MGNFARIDIIIPLLDYLKWVLQRQVRRAMEAEISREAGRPCKRKIYWYQKRTSFDLSTVMGYLPIITLQYLIFLNL